VNAPDISNADFAALLELVKSRFYAWHLKELRPERDRRVGELNQQRLRTGKWAVHLFQIYSELLECEVRERIALYAGVARESGSSEMLSKRRIEEFRQRIMTTVGHGGFEGPH